MMIFRFLVTPTFGASLVPSESQATRHTLRNQLDTLSGFVTHTKNVIEAFISFSGRVFVLDGSTDEN
jgi:hypothetical protein